MIGLVLGEMFRVIDNMDGTGRDGAKTFQQCAIDP